MHRLRVILPLILAALLSNTFVAGQAASAASSTPDAASPDPNYARMDYTLGRGDRFSTGALRPGVNRIVWQGNGAAYYDVMTINPNPFSDVRLARIPASARDLRGFHFDHRVPLGSYTQYYVRPSNAPVPGSYFAKTVVQAPAFARLTLTSSSTSEAAFSWTPTGAASLCDEHCTYSLLRDGREVWTGTTTNTVLPQEPFRTYSYVVIACNRGGCSDDSNDVVTRSYVRSTLPSARG